jgi:hypothetical protein
MNHFLKTFFLVGFSASSIALTAQNHPDSLYFDLSVVLKPDLTTVQQANVNSLRQQLNARTLQTLPRFGAERWACQVRKGAIIRINQNNQTIETTALNTANQAEMEAIGVILRSGTSKGVSENPEDLLTQQTYSTIAGTAASLTSYLRPQDTIAAGSTPVKIAILDSGLDLIQVNGKWVPRHESLRELFPNGSVLGYDFTQNTSVPQDGNGHGTFVTGIVHQILKQNGGLKRLPNGNPVVQVYIYKILDANAKGSEWSFMSAISQAIDEGIDVLNGSFIIAQPNVQLMSEMKSPMKVAMELIKENKILMSVAAGNNAQNIDNQLYEPTMYKNVNMIVTGSTNETISGLSSFSNYGSSQVDLFVRGEGIVSTYLNGTYRKWKGSSFAAPQTTAFSALLLTNSCATGDRVAINRKVRNSMVSAADLLNAAPFLKRSCTSQGILSPARAKTVFFKNNTCLSARLSKQLESSDLASVATLTVFPNPFETAMMLNLTVEKETDAMLQVVNLTGTVVYEEKRRLLAGQNAFSIAIDAPPSMYVLKIKGEQLDITQKILKQ